jgi:uncharacterized protein (DUF1015 family)
MAILRPFRAFRPPENIVSQVAAPPYDVVTTKEARQLANGNPHSFLHVSRPEIDLPVGTTEHDDVVYAQGKANLEAFIARGALEPEDGPRLYVYAQTMGQHRQVGVVGCASVQEYVENRIKKHEKTRQDKEDDRTRHIHTLRAHDEPVFLTYHARGAIDEVVAKVTAAEHTYDFVTADGIRHELWVAPGDASTKLERLFGEVDALFVADGHHRSASAARVHALRRGEPGEHDVFLAVVFPHDQMQILAYNRVVRDVIRRSTTELLRLFEQRFDVSVTDQPIPSAPRSFGLFLGDRWYRLKVRPGTVDDTHPVASLDCSICQDQILAAMFDIRDPRTDQNVWFVGGIRGPGEIERMVREEGWTLGLHLYPTSIDQLIAVSNAGLLMPPKSTWFEPKLRSGLFVHRF